MRAVDQKPEYHLEWPNALTYIVCSQIRVSVLHPCMKMKTQSECLVCYATVSGHIPSSTMATTLPHPVIPCSHALSTFKSLPPDAAGSWPLFNYSKKFVINIHDRLMICIMDNLLLSTGVVNYGYTAVQPAMEL